MTTHRTRIKICGITSVEEALDTAHAGADALGFVFYEKSSRYVSLEQARAICTQLPPFVSSVALVVNAEDSYLNAICDTLRPSYLQFHGEESAQECARWNMPYIKAIRMTPDINLPQIIQSHKKMGQGWCRGILLDAYHPHIQGGTGETFDWERIPPISQRDIPLILAGGLTPKNISHAVKTVQPWGVDVSSGVEYSAGRKCPAKVRAFIQGVLNAAVSLP